MQITFWGATKTVTGSMHEVRVDGKRLLLDCGLYQGRRSEARERNAKLPLPGSSVDGVVLSHAHIDHSGNLPSLVKHGFEGPIYGTHATVDLCNTMLPDSGYIQEKDAEYVNKRRRRHRTLDPTADGGEVEPLYTQEDVGQTLPLFRPIAFRDPEELGDGLRVEAYPVGHLLGAAAVMLEHNKNGKSLRLAFSGDVGRWDYPILRDPQPLPPADYLIMESTYGDRLHKLDEIVLSKLAGVVTRTAERGGRLVVPAFSVGRTQHLVLMLHQLTERKEVPSIPIFVDSPLAVNATEVYRRHSECYDKETSEFLWMGQDPFGFHRLRYVRSVEESKALNDYHMPIMIISASGMCEAGRILHHLRNAIEDPRNTVLITGYQAAHTLGRKIVERHAEVPIFGEPKRLRAEVVTLNELSAHGDQQDLLKWMAPIAATLKKVFLVHGEELPARSLASAIRERYGVEAVIPSRGDRFELS